MSDGVFRAAARAGALLAWTWIVLAGPALAHKPSDSYLTIEVRGNTIGGRWDIALRDLDYALGLDADGNGALTWGEVRARHAEIAAYATARLDVQADGVACTVEVGEQLVDAHTDGAYSVLPLTIRCPTPMPRKLALRYALFAELDPQHRGLLNLASGGSTRTAVLVPQGPAQAFEIGEAASANRWSQFADYLREGVWHIWIGFDHILFLLSLLLPSVLVRRDATWHGVERVHDAFIDVLKVVTAFTLAHSVTLSLAVLGVISLPSRIVESTIAASVVAAALNNVRPLVIRRLWTVAFGFGLVHGFGFASVLADLGLPPDALALALVGFNVGVELGQLAIVAIFVPLAYLLRGSLFYRRWVMVAGSLAIAVVAGIWLVERAFDVKLIGF